MLNKLVEDPEATCFLVEVIAKKSQNTPWTVSVDNTQMKNERIRRVSIDKFYEIVTGDEFAFKNLCEKLPIIIDDVVSVTNNRESFNSVIKELKEYSKNTLKSL